MEKENKRKTSPYLEKIAKQKGEVMNPGK